ncbi:hypothetical protein WA026_017781 [Henosepilachna vigintioctopunctata]|uniref:Tetraspanin n=1 Tax=Henosepilachna vigintioctopunctata TaxID=420089 RepID=A0AAW1U381_9CUCU
MASLKAKEVFCLCYALLLFFSGILLIGVSVVLCYKLFYHFKFVPSGSVGPFILLFLLGFVHLLLTWLAVKGPTRKHDCHIIMFMLITIALLFAECALGVWSMILWDEADIEVVLLMNESFDSVINEDFNKNSEWNKLQSSLKCCGLNGIGDYKTTKGSYPVSCCEEQDGPNVTCYQNSCRLPLARYVKKILLNGAIISFLSCVFQALGMFLFYSFYRSLRQDRSDKQARRITIQKELAENVEHFNDLNQSPSASVIPEPVVNSTPERENPKSHKSSNRRKGSAPNTPTVQANA